MISKGNGVPIFRTRQEEIAWYNAHSQKDLRTLLIPWFQFRAKITFKPNPVHRGTKVSVKKTFYGDEHSISYAQLLHKYEKEIILDREKGYENLINMIEHTKRGQFTDAKIYGRSSSNDYRFEILHRAYNHKGRLVIAEKEPDFSMMKKKKVLHIRLENNDSWVIPCEPTILSVAQVQAENI